MALILSKLVAVALLRVPIFPELTRWIVPPVLFVIPVIVPDPPRLRVPVFTKFAAAVLIVPEPFIFVVPALVRVVMEQLPLIVSVVVPGDALVNAPTPKSAVETVSTLLLVAVTPVSTAKFATVIAALSVFTPLPEKVRLLNVVAVAMVWLTPPKFTVLVPAVKFVPVPFQAVAVVALAFNVLEPPFKVPAVRAISPVNVWVKAVPKLSVPPAPFIVNAPPLTAPVNVAVPAVFNIETFPEVVKPPIFWFAVPTKLMALAAPAEKAPLFTKFPLMFKTLFNDKAAEASTVKFLQRAVPLAMFGEKGVPLGITTSVVAVGIPPHQLDAVFQSVLVTPVQFPVVQVVLVIPTVPVVAAKKVLFWFVAGELVLPQEPEDVTKLPKVRVLALWVNVPKFAVPDPMEKLVVTVVALVSVTPKVLLRARLLTVAGIPALVLWATVPLKL